MKLKICGVAAASTGEKLRDLIRKADQTTADLIEIRIDYLDDYIEPAEIRKLTSKPLIATNRPRWEGGFFRGGEPERIDTLTLAAASGFNYVDVEAKTRNLKTLVSRLRRLGAEIIASFHDQKSTPSMSRLLSVYNNQVKSGATVCKIVTKATKLSDNLRLFHLLESSQRRKPLITFCMGPLGIPSRVLSPLFGGFCTYAALDRNLKTAPGQLTLDELEQLYARMELSNWRSTAKPKSTE